MKKIKLTQRKKALVDDSDFEMLNQYKWFYGNRGYAARTDAGKVIYMHRFILGVLKGTNIDHIDGDGTNNQRSNLRIATHAQNMLNKKKYKNNTTGFRGVSIYRRAGTHAIRYVVHIQKDKKQITIGYYKTPQEASQAYNKKAEEYFGEFMRRETL